MRHSPRTLASRRPQFRLPGIRRSASEVMGVTVCLAPAHTIAYAKGGGHFWVYLQWALGLRSLGCNVIWLEVIDANEPACEIDRKVATVQARLARWGLANCLALTDAAGTLPRRLAAQHLDLQAATEAELL